MTIMASFANFDAVQEANQVFRIIILSAYGGSLLQMNKENKISNHNQVQKRNIHLVTAKFFQNVPVV